MFFQQLEVQLRLVFSLAGVNLSDVLLGLHFVATFHRDVFEVGVDGKVLAMADDDDGVGAHQLGDAGHLAVEDSTGLGTLGGGDVDAIVGHGDSVGDHGGMFAVGGGDDATFHRPGQVAFVVDEVG